MPDPTHGPARPHLGRPCLQSRQTPARSLTTPCRQTLPMISPHPACSLARPHPWSHYTLPVVSPHPGHSLARPCLQSCQNPLPDPASSVARPCLQSHHILPAVSPDPAHSFANPPTLEVSLDSPPPPPTQGLARPHQSPTRGCARPHPRSVQSRPYVIGPAGPKHSQVSPVPGTSWVLSDPSRPAGWTSSDLTLTATIVT